MSNKIKKPYEIKYNENTLAVINSLAKINSKLVFKKLKDEEENEYLSVNSKNTSSTILFLFSAPIDHFAFEGETIAFYDFQDFHSLLGLFKESKQIFQENEKLNISVNKANLKYYLADEDAIRTKINGVNFKDPDIEFYIVGDQLKSLTQLISKLGSKSIKFTYRNSELTIKCFSDEKDNSYEAPFDIETSLDTEQEFSITIDKEVFTLLPDADYKVSIRKEGIIRFTHESGEIEYSIFASEIEEE